MSVRTFSRRQKESWIGRKDSFNEESTPIGAHLTEMESDDDDNGLPERIVRQRHEKRVRYALPPSKILTMNETIAEDDRKYLARKARLKDKGVHDNDKQQHDNDKKRENILKKMLYKLPFGDLRHEDFVYTDYDTGEKLALQNDPEFMLHGVRKNVAVLNYAGQHLKNDPQFLLQAIYHDARALLHAPRRLREHAGFTKDAIAQNKWAVKYIADPLKKSKDFIMDILKMDGSALAGVSDEFKRNKTMVMQALKQNPSAIEHVHPDLRNDYTFRNDPEIRRILDSDLY